ncbi:MAG: hypothetical protein FWE37_06580 [Spirochaetaceae bacterium]|nr:hypothetical protein [Spirochaetaceae bacterium]
MTLKRIALVLIAITLLAFAACNKRGGSGSSSGNGTSVGSLPPSTFALPTRSSIIDAVVAAGGTDVMVTGYSVNGSAVTDGSSVLGDSPIALIVAYDYDILLNHGVSNTVVRTYIGGLFSNFTNVSIVANGTNIRSSSALLNLPTQVQIVTATNTAISTASTQLGVTLGVIDMSRFLYTVGDIPTAGGGTTAGSNPIVVVIRYSFYGPTTQPTLAIQEAVAELFNSGFRNVSIDVSGINVSSLDMGNVLAPGQGPQGGVTYGTYDAQALNWTRNFPGGSGQWLAPELAGKYLRSGTAVNSMQRYYIFMFLSASQIREYEILVADWNSFNNLQGVTTRDFAWNGSSLSFVAGSQVNNIPIADAFNQIHSLYNTVVLPSQP